VCSQPANKPAGHQRMQLKPFPESQNHEDWRESKSRRPFFRSLLEGDKVSLQLWGDIILEHLHA
jgi:hypothetical protein